MLIKSQKNKSVYIKIVALFIFFVAAIIFRQKFISSLLSFYQIFFPVAEVEILTQTEKEELAALRVENKILKDENKKLNEEFLISDVDEQKSVVQMLLGESQLYGDFFVNIPQKKTPYVGMSILSSGNIVVGQVEEILPNALKVRRMGTGKTFIGNSLESEESIELSSLGVGFYVGKVSGGSKIVVGDTIVLKGYPKIIVGTVVDIEENGTPLNNIFVRTPYNLNNKEIFYVIQ
jgi:cell shape-determining protein MreC